MNKTISVIIFIVVLSTFFSGCGSNKVTQDASIPNTMSTAENLSPETDSSGQQEASDTPSSEATPVNDQSTPASTSTPATPGNTTIPVNTPVKSKQPSPVKSPPPSNKPARTPGSRPEGSGNNNQKGNFAKADVMGEIDSISGSKLTIKVMEQPQFNRNDAQGQDRQGGTGQPQGKTPGFTGETKTITIPAGTLITTIVRSESGRETKNIELKDITKGNMIQVWYSDKAKGIISRVSISSFNRN